MRGYIHLYDATVLGHHDKQRCRNSWEEIASAVGLPVKTVQNKWNLARDRYVRTHNKARTSRTSGNPVLQGLVWLKVHVRHQNTLSNFDASVFYLFIHYTLLLSQHCTVYIIFILFM